ENNPDVLLITAASAALGISSIPFAGPVSAVRIGYINGEYIINPTFSQLDDSQLDLVVAGTKEAVTMVEAGAKEVSEELILEAIKTAHEAIVKIIEIQEDLIQSKSKPKLEFVPPVPNEELEQATVTVAHQVFPYSPAGIERAEREKLLAEIREKLAEQLGETCSAMQISQSVDGWLKKEVRAIVVEKGVRISGRQLDEVRPITCQVGLLPRTHGSGLFTRGLTQVLTLTTLGSLKEGQIIDSISPEETKRYMHHYNFPPFSTGEIKRLGTGRREVGHGALAERALLPVIPDEETFPYAIRLVSECMSSNGSTSMGSVCGSTLSLMDAGVPIKSPVAGVAMGLITQPDGKFAVLTDIEGIEDFFGDMDFKVAGTTEGITALQMDIKIKGMTYEIIEAGLKQALTGRLFILDRMNETISQSRSEVSQYAPKMTKISVDPEKVRTIIGPGGRVIRSIQEETGTTINIENDGTVVIGAPNEESAQKAIDIIEGLTKEAKVGEIYTGKVNAITGFGAFVEILPGKDGLVHISELENYRVASVEDVVSLGEEITVQVIGIDPQGKIKLSRKAVFNGPSGESSQDRPGNAPPRKLFGNPGPRR
ncbi:polyribonucleotide nucleotidyltransferase, partial [Chloroflexota bacterium]